MSQRADELLHFYRKYRIDDQLGFYASRRTSFARATGQALAISAFLLGLTTAAAALAGTDVGAQWLWSVLAIILPAASTALTAFSTLYSFEQQSKIYGDAARAVHAAARPADPDPTAPSSPDQDAAATVKRVEAVLRQEQAQWGQLTSQIEIPDDTKA